MARDGKEFLERLQRTKRNLWLEGARVDDVTAHPALAGGARTIAGIFDRQHDQRRHLMRCGGCAASRRAR
jgi:aromatic ring hydroxylase